MRGPKARETSSRGASRRMVNSGPKARSMWKYCSWTFLEPAESPVDEAMSSGRGMRLSKGLALAGRNPAGRSANSSTRCWTPIVSFFPHTGQRPPSSNAWEGSKHRRQFRWPSKWYFPSSGKNSRVPAKPSPVWMARAMAG